MITDSKWDICVWYHSETSNSSDDPGPIVCKQLMDSGVGDQLICNADANGTMVAGPINPGPKSSNLIGGLKENKQTCELFISNIQSWDFGYWNVLVLTQTNDTKKNFASFQITPNQRDVIALTGPTDVKVDQRVALQCISADGLPRPFKYYYLLFPFSFFVCAHAITPRFLCLLKSWFDCCSRSSSSTWGKVVRPKMDRDAAKDKAAKTR